MEIDDLLKIKREEILKVALQRGAKNVRIFGSAVRGETTPDSDIDFLVDLEPGRSLFDLGGLWMDLQDLLGRDVDVVTENALHWYIRDRVLAEAKPL
jgi:predicted nucleotidyltransferase